MLMPSAAMAKQSACSIRTERIIRNWLIAPRCWMNWCLIPMPSPSRIPCSLLPNGRERQECSHRPCDSCPERKEKEEERRRWEDGAEMNSEYEGGVDGNGSGNDSGNRFENASGNGFGNTNTWYFYSPVAVSQGKALFENSGASERTSTTGSESTNCCSFCTRNGYRSRNRFRARNDF